MTKIDMAYLKLLHCILAESPEEFYQNYPSKKRHSNNKNDYWDRMLRNDKDYYKKIYADRKARMERRKC